MIINRILTFALLASSLAIVARSQTAITTMALGPDQIGMVRTAEGLSTRVSFPEPVKEIICGDLYDAVSGRGSFIIQRDGSDIFLKPVVPKGMTNLFVKTGEKGDRVWNFDLVVVPQSQALRVLHITAVGGSAARPEPSAVDSEKRKSETEQQVQAILGNARAQAAKIVSDAERDAATIQADSAARSEKELQRRFLNALLLGVQEIKVASPRQASGDVVVTVEPRVLSLGGKSYLRYSIQNPGNKVFNYSAISLENSQNSAVTSEVIQSRPEKTIKPGEVISGVVIFDSRLIGPKDRISLLVRAENKGELARLTIAELH